MLYVRLFFEIKTQEIPRPFFFLPAVKKSHLSARDGAYCPITEAYVTSTFLLNCLVKDEIRAVDSQSDLRILFWLCLWSEIILLISNHKILKSREKERLLWEPHLLLLLPFHLPFLRCDPDSLWFFIRYKEELGKEICFSLPRIE